jgi:hypothetical protein
MPTIKVDLSNVNNTRDMLMLLKSLLNDVRLSEELREEYGKKLKELEL